MSTVKMYNRKMTKKTKIIIGGISLIIVIFLVLTIKSNSPKSAELNPSESNTLLPVESITHAHGLAIDAKDSSKVYIATHHGLLLLKNDKDLFQIGRVKDDFMGFSTHPTEPNVFYSSGHPSTGGNIGFQKTEDGGITWKKISDGINGPVDFHAMSISPANPDLIYGWYGGSLQKSTDGGKNWTLLNTNLSNVISIASDTKDPNTVYVATARGAYVSKDQGVTWSGLSSDIKNGAITSIAVNPSDSSKLLAFSDEMGFIKSNDNGISWQNMNSNLPNEVILFIAYDRNQSEKVYALSNKNNVYKSVDEGNSWIRVNL
jgi:photosystem II stability/assembly factor-like uncharacterized protein